MRKARFAAVFSTLLLAPAALADESAGVQILIDLQDPTQVSKGFCVHDSKLYSEDAQLCVSSSLRLICAPVDEADPAKGFKWTVAPDEKTPRCK